MSLKGWIGAAGLALGCVMVASGMATASTGWSIQPTPNPAGAANSYLYAVSCRSATACTTVGLYKTSSGVERTLAERWNGTTWSIQATPNPAGAANSYLLAVSCPSSTACTAVGGYYSRPRGTYESLAERWNGTTWSIQATPNLAGSNAALLTGVSCPSAAFCVAAGSTSAHGTLIERWNGTTWSIQATPRLPSTDSSLNGVGCSSATACTAVGYSSRASGDALETLAERWNGTKWTLQPTPHLTGLFNGVACSSVTACTAVGYHGESGPQETLAEHWNGTKWTPQAAPSPAGSSDARLTGVSCPATTACTAVGYYEQPGSGFNHALAERYLG